MGVNAASRRPRLLIADDSRVAWIALGLMLGAAGAFFFVLTHGTTLWTDEWVWALHRHVNTISSFLEPHNEHLSLVPVTLYKLLFATAGIEHYWPYRVMVVVAHLGLVALLFLYAERRVGKPLALLAASLILFLGPAWQDIIWPFQVAWLLSLAAGLGALLMLERNDRRGDAAASCLLALSLGSSGVGLAILLGLVVEVAWVRRRWTDAWIVGAPLFLYAAWWLVYQNTNVSTGSVSFVHDRLGYELAFVAHEAASATSALVGLGANDSEALRWGRALAAVAAVGLVWRLIHLRRLPSRVITLLTILLAFWISTALARAGLVFGGHVYTIAGSSRYLYVGGLFIVLLAVELASGAALPRWAGPVLALVAIAALVSNLGVFAGNARDLRGQAKLAASDLGALEIGRSLVNPRYISAGFPGYPLVLVDAASYFAMARDLGSPAATPAQIRSYPEAARKTADAELIRIGGAALQPSEGGARGEAGPAIESVTGGTVSRSGNCLGLRALNGRSAELRARILGAGVVVHPAGASATVALRRFANEFQLIGMVTPPGPAALPIARDHARDPWHVSVTSRLRAVVCAL